MGEVYRAHDLTLGRDVAMKIIADAGAQDPAAVRRFTREAQAASALNHPNIVRVYDVGESDNGPFIVMEMIEGRTLRSVMHTSTGMTTLMDVGRQLARALSVAHGAGIVHRDVKPENVMLRADGYVKIVDFGLARIVPPPDVNDSNTTSTGSTAPPVTIHRTPGVLVGTASYMAPEQARGEAAGSAADVFALGIMLYELAAGQHPFAGANKVGTVARILSDDPVPPAHFNSDLPASVNALILRMLDKDPRARPAAAEVDRILSEAAGGEPGARPAPAAVGRHTVGHENVRAALNALFDAADAGHGMVVALSGEPGIGKTTLVEDFLQELIASGRSSMVARGRCSERLAGAGAYLPWLEALDAMRDESGSSPIRVMKTLAPTWHAQVAPLATGDSPESRAVTVNRAGSQEWLKRELSTFLDELARHRPLVLFFDDVHWADASTIDLMTYLGARLAASRILLIATYRPSDLLLAKHPFLPLKLDLESRGTAREIHVDFLTEADVKRYLALEFPGHELPADFAAMVHARTEGNPLFMADLLRSLRDREVVRLENGVWRLTQPVTAFEPDMPASIRSMIELKIGRLDDADRRLLVAASVQGFEFDSAVVARSLKLDQGEVEDRLDALGRVHALVAPMREFEWADRAVSVRYRFVHVLYQNALYGSLGPTRRASLSAAVGEALAGAAGEQAAAHASELALLFESARDFSRAAEHFLIAANRARQVFAYREALTLAERGLAMLMALPATRERASREVAHLIAIALASHPLKGYAAPDLEEIYRRADALAEQLGEDPQLFGIVVGIGAFHFMRAELSRASEAIKRMQRFADVVGLKVMEIWTAWAFGATNASVGAPLAECHQRLQRGIALYDPADHPGLMLMTGFDAGLGCYFQDARVLWMLGHPDQSLARSAEARALACSLAHPLMTLFTEFFAAWVHQMRREPSLTLAATTPARREARDHGYQHLLAWLNALHGWALAKTASAAEGEATLRAAIALADAIGVKLLRPQFLALLAEIRLDQRRVGDARTTLDEALAIAGRTGEHYYTAEIHRLIGAALKQQGAAPEAIEESLRRAVSVARDQEARGFELRAATALAADLTEAGRGDEARAALANLVGWFTEGSDTADMRDARAILARP